jgi:hypothetical protein
MITKPSRRSPIKKETIAAITSKMSMKSRNWDARIYKGVAFSLFRSSFLPCSVSRLLASSSVNPDLHARNRSRTAAISVDGLSAEFMMATH